MARDVRFVRGAIEYRLLRRLAIGSAILPPLGLAGLFVVGSYEGLTEGVRGTAVLALIGAVVFLLIGLVHSGYVISRCRRVRFLLENFKHLAVIMLGVFAFIGGVGWVSRNLLGLGYVSTPEALALALVATPGYALGVLITEMRTGHSIWIRRGLLPGRVWRSNAYVIRPMPETT